MRYYIFLKKHDAIICRYDSTKLRIIHEIYIGLEIGIADFFPSLLFDENNLDDKKLDTSIEVSSFLSKISIQKVCN